MSQTKRSRDSLTDEEKEDGRSKQVKAVVSLASIHTQLDHWVKSQVSPELADLMGGRDFDFKRPPDEYYDIDSRGTTILRSSLQPLQQCIQDWQPPEVRSWVSFAYRFLDGTQSGIPRS